MQFVPMTENDLFSEKIKESDPRKLRDSRSVKEYDGLRDIASIALSRRIPEASRGILMPLH